MTRKNRTAANQLRKLDQQRVAEDHQALVACFTKYPDMAAKEVSELEELVTAATEAGHPPPAVLLGMAALVTDTTIRLADAATLDSVTGRLDRAAVEGYLPLSISGSDRRWTALTANRSSGHMTCSAARSDACTRSSNDRNAGL